MSEAENSPLISCMLTYEKDGQRYDKVTASLFPEYISFASPGFSSTVWLNSLSGVSAENYRIFAAAENSGFVLSMIGHLYEDFAKKFVRAFNEVVFEESLMKEKVHFEAEGQYISPTGILSSASFRICETALVILPDTHELSRIPFCMIALSQVSPYRFEITDKFGRIYVLQKMGRITDAFMLAYNTRIKELVKQTRETLGAVSPADDALASILMEGMAARVSDIRNISARFADALSVKLIDSEISKEYEYLKSVSQDMAISVKRGLMGELTGESIIILAPVFEKNIMFMESLGETSAATYVFKIAENGQASAALWNELLLSFNYSMLSVNFRREPIYLSADALKTEKYRQYAQALQRVPELRQLRALFTGRVMHNGFDSWKKSMDSYIK